MLHVMVRGVSHRDLFGLGVLFLFFALFPGALFLYSVLFVLFTFFVGCIAFVCFAFGGETVCNIWLTMQSERREGRERNYWPKI